MVDEDLEFFNDHSIRKVWHSGEEEWYLSVVDVVQVLTDSSDPKQYIKKMRARDKALKSKWGTICTPLQMLAPDGKMRKTQAANTEGILRIIQSIPSPKAEPFKTLLAKVGAERLEEIADRSVGFTFGKCNSAVFARTEIVGETQGTSVFWSEMGSSGAA